MTSALMVSTKTRIEPEMMPGAVSGSVTEVKTCLRLEPSVAAAASTSRGTFCRAATSISTMKGR
nr:hypothetical protein [Pseudaminobacter salicylatoxidans]